MFVLRTFVRALSAQGAHMMLDLHNAKTIYHPNDRESSDRERNPVTKVVEVSL
jgi:hypothetical protein